MILAPFNPLRIVKTSARFLHKYVCKMNKAYLRHLTEEDKFEISFQYVDPSIKINRQFNLCRQVSEPISTFTSRVVTNIEKIVQKKTKNKEYPVEVSLTTNGERVSDEASLKDIFSPPNAIVLTICGQEYEVVLDAPWIGELALPSSILANFPVYPAKFDAVNTNPQESAFEWFKSKNKNDWVRVGDGFVYHPSNGDIAHFLKLACLPRSGGKEGPPTETISSGEVQAGPGFCPFENRHKLTGDKCKDKVFRVVTYNILADLYCDSDFTREVLHPYCPPYALALDYRKQLIIKELTGYNADLICLQEVDRKVYKHDLNPIFSQLGYDSDFCMKRGSCAEGVALFYDREHFKRLGNFRLVLAEELDKNPLFSDIWAQIQTNPDLSERILDRSTVLQINILESLENEEALMVANTHLYFHPDADHIRLLQGAIIIRYITHLFSQFRDKVGNKRLSLILCGDFNSVPECGIYQLYTTGQVQEDHTDLQSNAKEAIKVALKQEFRLQSACGTPKYTNFTAGFADCLDYIYYEAANFDVVQVVPLPSDEELRQHTALPSVVFPSDHISLVSDLRWR